MTIFITGGCKNGKSSIAEDCCLALAKGGPLFYLATMQPNDDEDHARIKRHRESRAGKGFETIECQKGILSCIEKADCVNGTFILDSVTALMINELYNYGEDFSDFKADPEAANRVANDLCTLADKVKNIVFVSDYIYEEADNYSEYTEEYLRSLSTVDKAVAKKCDAVAEIILGNINMIKGELPL